MKSRAFYTLMVLVSLSATACEMDVEVTSWEGLDIEEFAEVMENPTADFSKPVVEELMSYDPASFSNTVQSVNRTLGLVQELMGPEEGEPTREPPEVEDGEVRSTNVYLRIACPGPDLFDNITDFSAGSIRLDTPLDIDLANLDFNLVGDVLLTYERCQAFDLLLDGRARAFYESVEERLAIDSEILVALADDTPLISFNPLLSYQHGSIDLLLRDLVNGSLRISIERNSANTFIVTTADGVHECTLALDDLGCEELR